MEDELAALPDDVDALKAALLTARAEVARVTAEAAAALAEKSSNLALIAHLKLQIEKLNRNRFGPRSERTARLHDVLFVESPSLLWAIASAAAKLPWTSTSLPVGIASRSCPLRLLARPGAAAAQPRRACYA